MTLNSDLCKLINSYKIVVFSFQKMTKTELKYLQGLTLPKNRRLEKKYLVEGNKNALEWIRDARYLAAIYATQEWFDTHPDVVKELQPKCHTCHTHEIAKISSLSTPTDVVVLCHMPSLPSLKLNQQKWYLALDGIRDPGNMGTIIRTADWFGITDVLVSADCVDVFNSKVIQSTMGSLLRVNIHQIPTMERLIQESNIPLYLTHLNGKPITANASFAPGIIMMGNESVGVKDSFVSLATELLFIPRIGQAESLNVAVATGIICHTLLHHTASR